MVALNRMLEGNVLRGLDANAAREAPAPCSTTRDPWGWFWPLLGGAALAWCGICLGFGVHAGWNLFEWLF